MEWAQAAADSLVVEVATTDISHRGSIYLLSCSLQTWLLTDYNAF